MNENKIRYGSTDFKDASLNKYKEFYTKLLAKLLRIKSGEMTLDDYIEEVKSKVDKI
jgi:hypothetical protein